MKDKVHIKEISDRKIWERFNLSFPYPAYFQSWSWGEVQKRRGIDVGRFGLFDGSDLVGIFQTFDIKAKRGHFIHVRHGPVIQKWNREHAREVLDFLKGYAKNKNASYIRISPLVEDKSENLSLFKEFGFIDSPTRNLDAENRWILPLNGNISEIFSKMRKTTRYIIRKGEGSNIKITRSTKMSDIEIFCSIYGQTAKLKQFVPHRSIREEFEQFGKYNGSSLYFASLNEKILAAAMVINYGKEAIYRHGATTVEGRNTSASYLLQWEAIKDAHAAGLKVYDFWGIAKDENRGDPWFGLSQFKKGFGGEQVNFLHSMDLPIARSYWLSFLIDYATKIGKYHIHNLRR